MDQSTVTIGEVTPPIEDVVEKIGFAVNQTTFEESNDVLQKTVDWLIGPRYLGTQAQPVSLASGTKLLVLACAMIHQYRNYVIYRLNLLCNLWCSPKVWFFVSLRLVVRLVA